MANPNTAYRNGVGIVSVRNRQSPICNSLRIIATQTTGMVQKTFGIYADDLSACRLFIEAGAQHIAAWFTDTLTGSMKAFEFFQFEEADGGNMDDTVQEVKQQSKLLSLQMDAATIVWENPNCTCIPEAFFSEFVAPQYLDTIAGEADLPMTMLAEHFNQYIILSRYPSGYADSIKSQLAEGPFSHKFSLLLKKYVTNNGAETIIRVIFYPSRFIIIAVKNNALQLIQRVPYSTADDALYAIMHTAAECGIDLNTTKIIATGLINIGSPLHDTLYRYLENFEIEQGREHVFAANGFAEHPPHYFLHFMQ